MKKICFSFIVTLLLFASAAVEPRAQSQAAGFIGTWVLDKEKTGTKDFPERLMNYKMMVGESENLLNVKSKVEGQVEVRPSRNRPSGNTGVSENTAGRGPVPAASGVSAVRTTNAEVEKSSYDGTLALYFTPADITYKLSGEELKVEIKQGEKVNGIARIKAKLDKSGQKLELTTIRRMRTVNGEMEITTWETWKLSKDGKTLKLHRTVETPTARDQIIMTMSKAS